MDPRLIALIGVAGLIAGSLLPLAPAMGADSSRPQSEPPAIATPLGALQIKTTPHGGDRKEPLRIRCDLSASWFGEPCQSTAKI
jgi:hypothetical protein